MGPGDPRERDTVVDRRARYERESVEVDRYTSSSFWDRRYHQRRLASVTSLLGPLLAGASRFLDVGCGSGEYLAIADEVGVTATVGVDLAVGYCRRARATATRAATCVGVGSMLPFRDRSFDVVLCSEVIEHLDPSEAIRTTTELRRVAARAVVVSTPNATALVRRIARTLAPHSVDRMDEEVGHINLLDASQVAALMSAPGWRVRGVGAMHVFPPVLGEMLRLPRQAERVVDRVERISGGALPSSGNCLLTVALRRS